MRKIISLFQRNYDGDRLVRNEIVPGAEWVAAGEGYATVKFDGTCCMVRDGCLFKRYDLKPGKRAPDGFEPAQDADPVTGRVPGWVPVGDGPEDRWHIEAWARAGGALPDGTYELCGPHIQGNPEVLAVDTLIPHGVSVIFAFPRDFDGIREVFAGICNDIEGVVWWHPDGRMVKIKARDFGLVRRPRQ